MHHHPKRLVLPEGEVPGLFIHLIESNQRKTLVYPVVVYASEQNRDFPD